MLARSITTKGARDCVLYAEVETTIMDLRKIPTTEISKRELDETLEILYTGGKVKFDNAAEKFKCRGTPTGMNEQSPTPRSEAVGMRTIRSDSDSLRAALQEAARAQKAAAVATEAVAREMEILR